MRWMSVSAKPPCSRGTGFCNAGLLAPDIQEAILEGRQAKGMQLEELTRAVPEAWDSPPGIRRSQPTAARVPLRCSQHRGKSVAPGRPARSDQPTPQTISMTA
jgi:hypothetical protein